MILCRVDIMIMIIIIIIITTTTIRKIISAKDKNIVHCRSKH